MRAGPALLRETAFLLVSGIAFALLANQFSPRGLSLPRDYFPKSPSAPAPVASSAPVPTNAAPTKAEGAAERLANKGLGVIGTTEAEELFRDPQFAQEQIIFIDARDDAQYQAGHIPGAFQFDRYYPEKYLPSVLPACLTANRIVVYCNGGQCEDSEFAALTLLEAGIPAQKVSVYLGGITEWIAQKKPIEIGERKSGVLKAAAP